MVLKIVIGIVIHLLIPYLGIVLFLKYKGRMDSENLKDSPILELLIVFVSYGGLLMVILTSFLWFWSGLASIGIFYLIFIAPFLMYVNIWRLWEKRKLSKYHKLLFKYSGLYYVIMPSLLTTIYLILK